MRWLVVPAHSNFAANTCSSARVLKHAAGVSFLILGFLGRLPAAMNQLGLLLIISASGRGLSMAGTTVAAVGLGTAVGAPFMGRLVDRYGAVRVLAGALTVQCLALCGVFVFLQQNLPANVIFFCAALLGLANPQSSSISRAIWSAIARRDRQPASSLRTIRLGLGFETAADESSYVIGPVVAGALVTLFNAQGAVLCLVLITLVGEGLFMFWLAQHQKLSSPTKKETSEKNLQATSTAAERVHYWLKLAPVFLCIAAVGVVFGTTQTALTAVNAAAGTPELTGTIYGAMGITSATAGLAAPSIQRSALLKTAIGGALIFVCSSFLLTLPSTAFTLALVLVMGAGLGTALATSYTRVESVAMSGRVTSLMTLAATCNVLGVSLGSVVTGVVGSNLHHANAPAVIAGVLIVLICVVQVFTQHKTRKKIV